MKVLVVLALFALCGWAESLKRKDGNHVQKKHYQLIVGVPSAATSFEKRDAVRRTWASLAQKSAVFFIIGYTTELDETLQAKLASEEKTHRDIVRVNCSDSYDALTEKNLQFFKYALDHFKFRYMMKADDDSFVRLDAIEKQLVTMPRRRLYWGYFHPASDTVVHKDPQHKNHDSYSGRYFPPYASGSGYVLSKDVVRYLVRADKLLPLRRFRNEDAALGIWLSALDVLAKHDPRFNMVVCDPAMLVMHPVPTSQLFHLVSDLKSNRLCHSTPPIDSHNSRYRAAILMLVALGLLGIVLKYVYNIVMKKKPV
eukprot:TRINITY_DN4367_c0_g2_i1.p1 TRINITY_DN4367_c0_g2~~TRINITY_DN4367_c0_g2_i1.p1  ORF type:complete len:336 (-),score=39.14 TRINITY_DN4367_c0_g2_i1:29-964(-)